MPTSVRFSLRNSISLVLISLIAFLGLLCLLGVNWMFQTWAGLTIEELIFHLTAPIEGTSSQVIVGFLTTCLFPALAVSLIILSALNLLKHHAVLVRSVCLILLILSSLSIAISAYWAYVRLDFSDFIRNNSDFSTFVEDNYVSPDSVEISFPVAKRNLIYIFLESMETTYVDEDAGGAFSQNVIPELTRLAQQYQDFSGEEETINGGISTYGTTWTAAAMFAQTCGLPMSPSLGSSIVITEDRLFPNVISLGDILESAGYTQTLLVGSYADFGARGYYFRSHGNFSIRDYPYYTSNGSLSADYSVWWGFEDEHLFEFAQQELLRMSEEGRPFNLTMLTADTHFEDGYVCDDCGTRFGENQYSNVFACSSRRVSRFVQWIQKQDFYRDTTIVICGDHLTMDSDYCAGIDPAYTRKVYTVFINAAAQPETVQRRAFSTLDMFPTTLVSLGVTIEGNRLGLGVNLFSSEQTLVEIYGTDSLNDSLSKRSVLLEQLTDYTTSNSLLSFSE